MSSTPSSSYGAPQAPVVNKFVNNRPSSSYGAPKSPVVSSYGAPKVSSGTYGTNFQDVLHNAVGPLLGTFHQSPAKTTTKKPQNYYSPPTQNPYTPNKFQGFTTTTKSPVLWSTTTKTPTKSFKNPFLRTPAPIQVSTTPLPDPVYRPKRNKARPGATPVPFHSTTFNPLTVTATVRVNQKEKDLEAVKQAWFNYVGTLSKCINGQLLRANYFFFSHC